MAVRDTEVVLEVIVEPETQQLRVTETIIEVIVEPILVTPRAHMVVT